MEIADWARDPEILFDQPPVESAAPLIALGSSQYQRAIVAARVERMGADDTFFTAQETYDLAIAKEDGVLAAEILETLDIETVNLAEYDALERRVAAGRAAREALITTNLGFAATMARASMNIVHGTGQDRAEEAHRLSAFSDITKLASARASLDDRIQVANLGLITAVDAFKPQLSKRGKPTSFLAFAKWRIHSTLYRYCIDEEQHGTNIPNNIQESIKELRTDQSKMSEDRSRQLRLWSAGRHFVSLEDAASGWSADEEREDDIESHELAVEDLVVDPTQTQSEFIVEHDLLVEQINEVLGTLSERQATIIARRFGLGDDFPQTFDDIAKIFGVTRERIRQLQTKSMSQLRHPSRSEYLWPYMEQPAVSPAQVAMLNKPSSDNVVLGSLLRPARPDSSSQSTGEIVQPDYETGQFLQRWQADPSDEWEEPVRRTPADIYVDYERAGRSLSTVLLQADPVHFSHTQAKQEDGSYYPVELLTVVNETCGPFLQAHHIEAFWNQYVDRFSKHLEAAHDDFAIDRLSLFFSQLLAERMTDNDVVTLDIPPHLVGRLDMFGSNLQLGELVINGDLGDFAGYRLGGIARMVVNGNVGDYAASEIKGLASVEVAGNAGAEVGYGSMTGTIDVHGQARSLTLRPGFTGDVTLGNVGSVAPASPKDNYMILRP